jgi:hypothetical protein
MSEVCEEKNCSTISTLFMSFMAGAAIGAGIALLFAPEKKKDIELGYDEEHLFV